MKNGRTAVVRTNPALILSLIVPVMILSGCSRVLLDERFHNDSLTNWTVSDDPETIEGPSLWRVEPDGWLHQRSNIWGRRGDFLGRWYGTFLVAGDTRWKDYTLTLQAEPKDDDGFGVVFRFADSEHFYRLLFIEDGFNGGPLTRLDKRNGSDYTELWSEKKGFRIGRAMFIQIEVNGDVINATVDGRRLFSLNDDDAYGQGKIGLFCYAQSDQAFDDVKVTVR